MVYSGIGGRSLILERYVGGAGPRGLGVSPHRAPLTLQPHELIAILLREHAPHTAMSLLHRQPPPLEQRLRRIPLYFEIELGRCILGYASVLSLVK